MVACWRQYSQWRLFHLDRLAAYHITLVHILNWGNSFTIGLFTYNYCFLTKYIHDMKFIWYTFWNWIKRKPLLFTATAYSWSVIYSLLSNWKALQCAYHTHCWVWVAKTFKTTDIYIIFFTASMDISTLECSLNRKTFRSDLLLLIHMVNLWPWNYVCSDEKQLLSCI